MTEKVKICKDSIGELTRVQMTHAYDYDLSGEAVL